MLCRLLVRSFAVAIVSSGRRTLVSMKGLIFEAILIVSLFIFMDLCYLVMLGSVLTIEMMLLRTIRLTHAVGYALAGCGLLFYCGPRW